MGHPEDLARGSAELTVLDRKEHIRQWKEDIDYLARRFDCHAFLYNRNAPFYGSPIWRHNSSTAGGVDRTIRGYEGRIKEEIAYELLTDCISGRILAFMRAILGYTWRRWSTAQALTLAVKAAKEIDNVDLGYSKHDLEKIEVELKHAKAEDYPTEEHFVSGKAWMESVLEEWRVDGGEDEFPLDREVKEEIKEEAENEDEIIPEESSSAQLELPPPHLKETSEAGIGTPGQTHKARKQACSASDTETGFHTAAIPQAEKCEDGSVEPKEEDSASRRPILPRRQPEDARSDRGSDTDASAQFRNGGFLARLTVQTRKRNRAIMEASDPFARDEGPKARRVKRESPD